jgi:hypothetical protein
MQWSLLFSFAACFGVVSAGKAAMVAEGKQAASDAAQAAPQAASDAKQGAHVVKGKINTKMNGRRLLPGEGVVDDAGDKTRFEDDPKVRDAMSRVVSKMSGGTDPKNIQVATKATTRRLQDNAKSGKGRVVIVGATYETDYELAVDPLANFSDVEKVFKTLKANGDEANVDKELKAALAADGAEWNMEVTDHYVLDPAFDDQIIPSGVMPTCHDFTGDDVKSTNPMIKRCAYHILWAKNEGIVGKQEWYSSQVQQWYADEKKGNRSANVTVLRFQCSLYEKTKDGVEGDGHQCIIPTCSAVPGMEAVCPGLEPTAKVQAGGMAPWMMWLLLIAGVALCGLVGFCVYNALYPKKAPKKRAIKKVEPVPTPAPTTSIMMPTYTMPVTTSVTTAPPVYYDGPPVGSVAYAAPSVTYAAPPVTYAAPSISYAAPGSVTYAAPQYAQVSAFDMIDTNHDGTITREEFAYAMQHRS